MSKQCIVGLYTEVLTRFNHRGQRSRDAAGRRHGDVIDRAGKDAEVRCPPPLQDAVSSGSSSSSSSSCSIICRIICRQPRPVHQTAACWFHLSHNHTDNTAAALSETLHKQRRGHSQKICSPVEFLYSSFPVFPVFPVKPAVRCL